MENLLKETIKVLDNYNKSTKDVLWVGNDRISFSWEQFCNIADFEYGNSWSNPEISRFLVIVGDNWWLERVDYDFYGSDGESWEFKTLPKCKPTGIPSKNDLESTPYD